MFKGRIGLWVTIVVVCLLFNWLTPIVPTWFESNDLNVKIDVETDPDMAQILSNEKINKIKVRVNNEAPGVIITTGSVEDANDYVVYEDGLYSPLVMYVRADIQDDSEGFINVPDKSYCYKVDLYSILVAMEQGKEWGDLGFNKRVISGSITLHIPNKQSACYNEVVELFYLTLSNGKIVDEEARKVLEPRVDALLDKCHKVTDICSAVYDEYLNPSKEHKVFIGPEYLYQRGRSSSMSYSASNDSFTPVYFLNTVCLTADVYVKSAESGEDNVGTKFVENIRNKRSFMATSGWRVKNSTFDLSNISSVYYESPSEFATNDSLVAWIKEKNQSAAIMEATTQTVVEPTNEMIAATLSSETESAIDETSNAEATVKADVENTSEKTMEPTKTVTADPVNSETITQKETEEEPKESIVIETTAQEVEGNDEDEGLTVGDVIILVFIGMMIFIAFITWLYYLA